MAGRTDNSGATLIGEGSQHTQLTASGLVKTGAGRIARILVVSGTGSIAVYDDVNANTAANEIWSGTAAAGGSFALSCPMSNGIYVALGASTTVTVVFS